MRSSSVAQATKGPLSGRGSSPRLSERISFLAAIQPGNSEEALSVPSQATT